jgi:hypothetical protein
VEVLEALLQDFVSKEFYYDLLKAMIKRKIEIVVMRRDRDGDGDTSSGRGEGMQRTNG